MTESEWLAFEKSHEIMRFLCAQPGVVRRKSGRRKLRLFGCACCRQLWARMADPRTRAAVEVAERMADDSADDDEAEQARSQAEQALRGIAWSREDREQERVGRGHGRAAQAGCLVVTNDYGNFAMAGMTWGCGEGDPVGYQAHLAAQHWQAAVLRYIFGNPFRPVRVKAAWVTPTVTVLAWAAYEQRALPSGELEAVRLAVLSDALEEAGCDDADVLGHLRSPGPHVRGCWAVDLLTGRALA